MFFKILLPLALIFSIAYCSSLPLIQFGNTIRDLYGNSTANMILMANEWTITGLISNSSKVGQYNGSPVLGGPGIIGLSGSFKRSYTQLPIHNVISFDIGVKMLGNWKDNLDGFSFVVDGQIIKTFSIQKVGVSDSKSPDQDLDTRLIGNFPHSSSSITISFTFELNSLSATGTFAINDLGFSFINSPSISPSNALLTLVDTITNAQLTGCPSGFYKNAANSCSLCDKSCQDCFGPSSSQCFQCTWSYSLIGDQCLKCSSNCGLCSGTACLLCNPGFTLASDGTCILSCPQGSLLMLNKTCSSSCPLPLVPKTQNNVAVCSSPCNANEYLYANGSCLNSCSLTPNNENGFLFCLLQCGGYVYQNNTCLPTCLAPYIRGETINGNGKTCTFPCPSNQYLDDSGKCITQCPSLYAVKVESVGRFCFNPCAGQYLYRNGSCLATCPDGFIFKEYNETGDYLCTYPCDAGQYLYSNRSCLSTCRNDFISENYGGEKFCKFPCGSYQVLYPNGTCADQCGEDFYVQNENNYKFCMGINGCPSPLDYKYQNGSCLSSCPAPFIKGDSIGNSESGRKCFSPCSNGQYLLANGTCIATCPNHYIVREDGLCSNPCNSTQYFFRNGSCLTSCPDGYKLEYRTTAYVCTNPCDPGLYLYANRSCLSTCQPGFTANIYGDERLCSFPCNNSQSLYPNGTCVETCEGDWYSRWDGRYYLCTGINDCPSPFDYKYQNGSCSSSCPDPYIVGNVKRAGRKCFPPCPSGQVLLDNGTCMASCPTHYIIKEDGLCSNPCNSSDNFYRNGSCLSTCPRGFKQDYQSPNWYCTNPCDSELYLYDNSSCLSTCRSDFIAKIYGEEKLCYFPCRDGNIGTYLYPNGSCGGPCGGDFVSIGGGDGSGYGFCVVHSGAVNKCPTGFLYQEGSCRESCPFPYVSVLDAGATKLCNLPCPVGNYYYSLNGTCVKDCETEFRTVKNSILSCEGGAYNETNDSSANGNYTTVLELYVRYDIPLGEFYNQNAIIKFLELLASLLEIDISQITIVSIREGSTIIESKVTVISEPDSKSKAVADSKVKTMSQKFNNAAKKKALNMNNIKALNSRSSIVIPGQGEQMHVEESSSSGVIIGVVVGVAVAIIGAGIIAYSVYRRKQKLKMRRVAKIEAARVHVNPAGVDQQAPKDEELAGLAQVSIVQVKENTEDNGNDLFEPVKRNDVIKGPFIGEENICQEETKNNLQVIEEKDEVQDQNQKVMSLNEIMRKVEAEDHIELNLEN